MMMAKWCEQQQSPQQTEYTTDHNEDHMKGIRTSTRFYQANQINSRAGGGKNGNKVMYTIEMCDVVIDDTVCVV